MDTSLLIFKATGDAKFTQHPQLSPSILCSSIGKKWQESYLEDKGRISQAVDLTNGT
jgi:hypothetical protein